MQQPVRGTRLAVTAGGERMRAGAATASDAVSQVTETMGDASARIKDSTARMADGPASIIAICLGPTPLLPRGSRKPRRTGRFERLARCVRAVSRSGGSVLRAAGSGGPFRVASVSGRGCIPWAMRDPSSGLPS